MGNLQPGGVIHSEKDEVVLDASRLTARSLRCSLRVSWCCHSEHLCGCVLLAKLERVLQGQTCLVSSDQTCSKQFK